MGNHFRLCRLQILSSNVDLNDFHSGTPYHIMFGPDVCGNDAHVQLIFSYKGKNLPMKKKFPLANDDLTHLYTLLLKSDKRYEILIDGKKEREGKLEEDWDFLPPKKIKDPAVSKPKNWDDREYIDDVDDKKPDDWDKPEHIKDPDAKKPEDWDEDVDELWQMRKFP
uniref:Calreticulin n=1 Tax=Parascaris equorum TaxID=6256 RepID=A0A914S4T0_PAREQ